MAMSSPCTSPPPLALGLVVKEEGSRRWLVESLVWAFGVGEHEPLGQLPVEESEVGEEEILVIVDEGLLKGAIETLCMSVHLGCLGVGGPASDPPLGQGLDKARLELAAVLGEHDVGRLEEETQRPIQGPACMTGILGGNRPGEGQAALRIDETHDVAAETVAKTFDGIHRPAFEGRGPGPRGLPGPRAPSDGPGTAPRIQTGGGKTHLVGCAGDDPPDRGDRGPRKAVLLAPGPQQDRKLLLAQIGVKGTETADLGPEARVGPGPAPAAGGGTPGREGGRMATLGLKFRFPAVEGAARDLEGIERDQKAVGVPEP